MRLLRPYRRSYTHVHMYTIWAQRYENYFIFANNLTKKMHTDAKKIHFADKHLSPTGIRKQKRLSYRESFVGTQSRGRTGTDCSTGV